MHREFRKLLDNAKGVSQQIIAINLDIRRFTPFCQGKESFDVAAYITNVYIRIIDRYFSDAAFYKPTGDGLLIVILCKKNIKETVKKTIGLCLELHEKFSSLCEGEDLIYFPTPDKIGIGIARGTACCLTSEGKTLDYSGKVLNLASRLMNMARPSGIIFHPDLGFGHLSDEQKEQFEKDDEVYVRGIAEEEPISTYYTKKLTVIPDHNKNPIIEPEWEIAGESYMIKDIREIMTEEMMTEEMIKKYGLLINLKQKPLNANKIILEISYRTTARARFQVFRTMKDSMIKYNARAGIYQVCVYFQPLFELLQRTGAQEDTEVTLQVHYPVAQKLT